MIAFRQVGASSVWLVALSALVGTTGAAWADCKPAAVAQGDPVLVKGLIARLAANGIATSTTSGCPAVRVDIEQHGSQVHVRLADASQRTGERDVQDVATAAALVESWTYQEIDAGTLPDPAPAIIEAPHTSRFGIAASVISGLGTNGGTTWIGGSISACMRVGSFCTGATLRSQLDTTATGETTTIAQDTYSIAALATLDVPRRVGRFVVSPGIGVGYGYAHATTHHHDAMNNLLDVPSGDHQLRAGVHAALLDRWSDHLAAFVDLWTDLAVARSDSSFGPTGAVSLSLGLRLE